MLISLNKWKWLRICLKKLMVKNTFIEKTYVVGTHWNCLIEAIPMCTYNICYWKWGRKLFGNLHFPSIMFTVFTSLKHPKLPISFKIPVTLLQIVYICMTAISPNSSSWTFSLLTCLLRGFICSLGQVHYDNWLVAGQFWNFPISKPLLQKQLTYYTKLVVKL